MESVELLEPLSEIKLIEDKLDSLISNSPIPRTFETTYQIHRLNLSLDILESYIKNFEAKSAAKNSVLREIRSLKEKFHKNIDEIDELSGVRYGISRTISITRQA